MESSVKAHSFLKKISGSNAGKIYPLFSTLCTIGRASHNTVCIPEPFLSRKHCSIRHEYPNWIITDYGGLNGTYLNGQKMESSGYRVLKDKTIVFLGDPEESTCGFIFLTSLPVSAQAADLSGNGASSSSLVPVSDSLPSLFGPCQPFASTPIDLVCPSNSPPDQSDDVSSTRRALSAVDNATEGTTWMDTNQPNEGGISGRERIRRMFQRPSITPSMNSLNDRIASIPYDPNYASGQPDNREKIRDRMKKLREMMRLRNRGRNASSMSPLNDRMLPIFYDASVTSPRSTPRSSTDLIYPILPLLPSSSIYPAPSTSQNPEVISIDDDPTPTVPETNEEVESSSGVDRIILSEAGSSRGTTSNPPEFDVLDMLVDSIDSDSSDSDCSLSSMDSLRTRIRKQKLKSNRALTGGENQSLNSSTKGLNSSTSSDEVQVIESRNDLKEKEDSQNFQDSESLICNIEDGVKDCVTKLENEDWMGASKADESDALQYLKERVLNLQKNVMDATEELKNALEKNKEQQAIIQDLQNKQGISREQLTEELESELSCNICTEVLVQPVILDCGHIFCQYCIGVWKKKKKQCPNCRDPIKTENEVRVLEGYINKVVEHLEPMYRMKRSELIEARKTETVKLKKSTRKRTPSYRVAAALGGVAPSDMFPELRVYRSLQNGINTRHNLTVRLRHLHQRNENPLLRRLVDRIERGSPHPP